MRIHGKEMDIPKPLRGPSPRLRVFASNPLDCGPARWSGLLNMAQLVSGASWDLSPHLPDSCPGGQALAWKSQEHEWVVLVAGSPKSFTAGEAEARTG